MGDELTGPQKIYNQLWSQSSSILERDEFTEDPFLQNKKADQRRGVTLVTRPESAVREKVKSFLRDVASVCPGQHFYQPAELHLTVLAVFPGSESWRSEIHRLSACRQILEKVLENCPAFSVKFRGVTISPEAVLVQGFPQDTHLARLRDDLRVALRNSEAAGKLDFRYKISAAHLTVMRFSRAGADWKRLLNFLQDHRETDFGETTFRSLQLIWGDWYASANVVRTLREYALTSQD